MLRPELCSLYCADISFFTYKGLNCRVMNLSHSLQIDYRAWELS